MRHGRALLAPAVFFGLAVSFAVAQDLCQPFQAAGDSRLQYKNRGNRCEGLYLQHIGAQALAIVSFTLGPINYSLAPETKLSVTIPGQNSSVWIRAIPKSSSLGYEMDAQATSESPLLWPVKDVLLPEHLTANQLGVFAWKSEQGVQVFVPVSVATSGASSTPSHGVLLSIRPSFDVQVLKWRWSPVSGNACGEPGPWRDGSTQTIDAGQTVAVQIPQSPGRHCIDFAAQGSTTDWFTAHFQVEEPEL